MVNYSKWEAVNYSKQEDFNYRSQQEETYLALPNRKCRYFTTPARERKIFLLPINKLSQWKHHSSTNEKPSSPELLTFL